MAAEENGGSAFPGAFSGHCEIDGHAPPCGCYVDKGMTLQDYFAGCALKGLLAYGAAGPDVSKIAYQHANYMLKARAEAQKR